MLEERPLAEDACCTECGANDRGFPVCDACFEERWAFVPTVANDTENTTTPLAA